MQSVTWLSQISCLFSFRKQLFKLFQIELREGTSSTLQMAPELVGHRCGCGAIGSPCWLPVWGQAGKLERRKGARCLHLSWPWPAPNIRLLSEAMLSEVAAAIVRDLAV